MAKETITCVGCGISFVATYYGRMFCKQGCRTEFRRNNAVWTPEYKRQWTKKYREENRDRMLAYGRGSVTKARNKRYADRHKIEIAARRAAAKKVNPEAYRAGWQKYRNSPKGQAALKKQNEKYYSDRAFRFRSALNCAKIRAKQKGIAFDPALYDLILMSPPKSCACCGIDFVYEKQNGRKRTPTLDRVENTIGYTADNTQIICWLCNVDKADMSIEKVERLLVYMKKYSPSLDAEVLK